MACGVGFNLKFAGMVIVVMLSQYILFIITSVLITYTKHEFQLQVIMVGVKCCIAAVKMSSNNLSA
jgi:hypothetical protein